MKLFIYRMGKTYYFSTQGTGLSATAVFDAFDDPTPAEALAAASAFRLPRSKKLICREYEERK